MTIQNQPSDIQTPPDISTQQAIPDVVIITGMSGSGRTQAMHAFEDMGYYCIDNLPPRLIIDLASIIGIFSGQDRHLAVTCDVRSQGLFDEMSDAIARLKAHNLKVNVLFLDCSDEILVRRYKETRRRHPLAHAGESLPSAIARERAQLSEVKAGANMVIDTSAIRPQALRDTIRRAYSHLSQKAMLEVRVISFGFKHGAPQDADLMIDVRFLPNPFYIPKLKPLTGNDEPVATYVLEQKTTSQFLEAWQELLEVVMPGYVKEGKTMLTIAVGCTGGQHRSVVIAIKTAEFLKKLGYATTLEHRDVTLAQKPAGTAGTSSISSTANA